MIEVERFELWLSRIVLLVECVGLVIHSALARMEEGKTSGLGSPITFR